jgi:hypothetical protein
MNGSILEEKDAIWNYSENSSYSGCDIIPYVYGINPSTNERKLFAVGNLMTVAYSIHRDAGAVRTLGRSLPKGFGRGPYTIAGSLIFSVFNERALYELSSRNSKDQTQFLAGSLPGFDIYLHFTNEYGEYSSLIIRNVRILDEGQSHSINDAYIENVMGYIAGDIDMLKPVDNKIMNAATFHASNGIVDSKLSNIFDYSYLPTQSPDDNISVTEL